jgi:hypothetical protein
MRRNWEANAAALSRYLNGPRSGPPPGGAVTNWEDYLGLFRGASPGQPIGEASVGYLWSRSAARLIHERIPDARIFMILRNPADRAFSHYNSIPPHRRRDSFTDAVRKSAAATSGPPLHVFNPFLEFGMYAAQVERYLTRFPKDRIRIFLHDDFVADREGMVRQVFEFLGVRPDVPLDLSKRHNEAKAPRFPTLEASTRPLAKSWRRVAPPPLRRAIGLLRWRSRGLPQMSFADRAFLVDYYGNDIRRLQDLIGRDLSEWLRARKD